MHSRQHHRHTGNFTFSFWLLTDCLTSVDCTIDSELASTPRDRLWAWGLNTSCHCLRHARTVRFTPHISHCVTTHWNTFLGIVPSLSGPVGPVKIRIKISYSIMSDQYLCVVTVVVGTSLDICDTRFFLLKTARTRPHSTMSFHLLPICLLVIDGYRFWNNYTTLCLHVWPRHHVTLQNLLSDLNHNLPKMLHFCVRL